MGRRSGRVKRSVTSEGPGSCAKGPERGMGRRVDSCVVSGDGAPVALGFLRQGCSGRSVLPAGAPSRLYFANGRSASDLIEEGHHTGYSL